MNAVSPWGGRTLHFVGIGGCGMSGLALVAHALGAHVSGSDLRDTPFLAPVRRCGIEVALGHDAANVPVEPRAEIVHSSATGPENPERIRGAELGLRARHRGELLAEISGLRRCIAVAGTHGKTTTAAMIAHALAAAGEHPGYLIGGTALATGKNAEWGSGEWLVVETDESDRSLLALHPEIAVLTNVELEHVREYATREEVDDVFRRFLAQSRHAVLWDRRDVLELRDGPRSPFDAHNVRLTVGGSCFRWHEHEVRLGVPGAHNARNGAAALEACRLAGADPRACIAALATFPGTARRLQEVGLTSAGARIFDDYAHHPTAVAETLAAARTFDAERLVAVLQPHSYARTRVMASEFGIALAAADLVVVLPITAGRERAEDHQGVTGRLVADAATAAGAARVRWADDFDAAEDYLRNELGSGDLCVMLGSGDIDTLAWRLLVGRDGER